MVMDILILTKRQQVFSEMKKEKKKMELLDFVVKRH